MDEGVGFYHRATRGPEFGESRNRNRVGRLSGIWFLDLSLLYAKCLKNSSLNTLSLIAVISDKCGSITQDSSFLDDVWEITSVDYSGNE